MNWSKIISGAKAFITLLTKMKGLFSLANLKTLAIVAAVVLLALIVEDFINFLMGNDSVIGTIFDKAGIGADNARKLFSKHGRKLKNFCLMYGISSSKLPECGLILLKGSSRGMEKV